jgi:phospholipase C
MFETQQAYAHLRKTMASLLTLAIILGPSVTPALAADKVQKPPAATATPIQHLVVIFQENISFDHYFGTYPNATNPSGEPSFTAAKGTPSVNGLTGGLLTANPNLNPTNLGASNPFRLDRSQAVTPDQDHDYTAEQQAFDAGLLDLFPTYTGSGGTDGSLVMGYFDGNSVTALWNYAQGFAMSDNSYSTTFGPSTPGVINLVSGQTNGVVAIANGTGDEIAGGPDNSLTVIGDPDPVGDVCSNPTRNQVTMGSLNIGDLLNSAGVSWGSFMGGFNLNIVNPNGTTGCKRSSAGLAGTTGDYIPHHSFFNYWASTANYQHTRPASISEIGHGGPANHQYDVQDFYTAAEAGNLPAVSFLKAPAYQDGHAGYSDPIDEQSFLVNTINLLESLPTWKSTAVVILYDDSDGWYDHQMGSIVNTSNGPADALNGPGLCGNAATSLPGLNNAANPHALGRCGYGMRQPFLVVSPWARQNFVDHSLTDQTSVIHFIEDNWLSGQRLPSGSFDAIAGSINQMFDFSKVRAGNKGKLFLDPNTGEPQ